MSHTLNWDTHLHESVDGLIIPSKLHVIIGTICVLFIWVLTAGDQKPKGAERHHCRNDKGHPHDWDPAYPRLVGFRFLMFVSVPYLRSRPPT